MHKILLSAAALGCTALSAIAQDAPAYVAPGTELKVGESAVVPFLIPNGPEVPIELTITEIEKGTRDDLEGFAIPPEMAEYRPIFVRYAYTNLSDEDLSHMAVGSFVGVDDRNQEQMSVNTRGARFDKCRADVARDVTRGKSGEGCMIYMIHENGDLKAAAYKGHYRHETGKDTRADFPIYYNPVRWVPADAAAPETQADGQGEIIAN